MYEVVYASGLRAFTCTCMCEGARVGEGREDGEKKSIVILSNLFFHSSIGPPVCLSSCLVFFFHDYILLLATSENCKH